MRKVSRVIRDLGIRYAKLYSEERKYGRRLKYWGTRFSTPVNITQLEEELEKAGVYNAVCELRLTYGGKSDVVVHLFNEEALLK